MTCKFSLAMFRISCHLFLKAEVELLRGQATDAEIIEALETLITLIEQRIEMFARRTS